MEHVIGTQLPAVLSGHRGALRVALLALGLAWLLTKTSASLAGNLPLALLTVFTARWLLAALDRQQRVQQRAVGQQPPRAWRQEAPPSTPAPTLGMPPGAAKPDSWRKFVRAPVVEEAWARFAGSILQEFVYDAWWSSLTPDREFPAEVRRLLNAAFGQLALRARQLDLRAVMNDLCELTMEQVELYRDTRESILLATQQPHCLRDMSAAARDRAFQREMRAEKNLHPALQTPDGHYKYLRAVSEGVVAYLLDLPDLQRPAARIVCRELLASCVFRPLMMYFTPYYANKALYAALKERAAKKPAERQREADEVSAALASVRSEAMRGHFEFEQRLLKSVAAEDTALLAARQLRHQLRSKLSQHARSKSVDNLGLSAKQAAHSDPAELPAQAAAAGQERLHSPHHRARSCSPAEMAGLAAAAASAMAAAGDGAGGGTSSSQRGRTTLASGQVRPPRPPSAGMAVQQQQQQQEQEQQAQPPPKPQQQQERSPFDVFNVASAMASVLMPGAAAAAQQRSRPPPHPQQQGSKEVAAEGQATQGAAGAGWRRPAEAQEAALLAPGDGWETVDVSEASLTLPPRDFSTAHLLAPLADQRGVASVAPRASSSSSSAGSGMRRGIMPAGFVGRARAKVVAADLNTTGKEYVEFKVRVADDSDEWTVSRRYRNFESLHRQLRLYPDYRLKLPPKRIFVHSNSVEFVEERREALDKYLQALLAHGQLSQSSDLYEFLRSGSQLYELSSPRQPIRLAGGPSGTNKQQQQQQQQQQQDQARKMLGGLSKAVMHSTHSVGRGLSSASGAVVGTMKQGVSELASAASGGVARVAGGVAGAAGAVRGALTGHPDSSAAELQEAGLARRVRSVPNGLHRASGSSSSDQEAEVGVPVKRGNSGSALPRPAQREKSAGLLSKASTRIKQAMQRESSSQQLAGEQLEPSGHSSSSSATVGSEQTAEQQLSSSPSKRGSRLFSSLRRSSKSRSVSPQKQPRERSPSRKPRRGAADAGGSVAGSRRASVDLDSKELGGTGEVPPHLASSLRSPSPAPASPVFSFPVDPSLDMEDCAGISGPLYEMVDCLFQLQTRGFFRRQVFAVARQMLSLVAGEAIDAYLTAQLRLLRQQHTIGRIIAKIQTSLWPGGVWFQHTPAAQAAAAAARAAAAAAVAADEAGVAGVDGKGAGPAPGYVRPAGMDPEQFLTPGGPAPLDEDEIREAVEQLLLRRAPAALVRLIGKSAYASGMQDLFGMLQSPTFCFHLGYGCLEVALVHLFPELKSLFRTLQHGGLG